MNKYDSIQCMNVYSREYAFPYKEIGSIIEDFLGLCRKNNLKPGGNFFYAVKRMDKDANMEVEFFYPAENTGSMLRNGLKFQTYYLVENMISVVVMDDFETNMEKAYAALLMLAEENGLKILSPFYNEIVNNGKELYYIVKVVAEKKNEEEEE